MNDLLELAISAHGGAERWNAVKSIDVTLTISGGLFESKGFPERLKDLSVSIDVARPLTIMRPYGGVQSRGLFRPERVWIESDDGRLLQERRDPRASFAGHTRPTPWDELHRLYFLGYALWNYLTTPFLFARPGFELKERENHSEDGEVWRVLQVTYPADMPAHCDVQLLYFDTEGMLKRLDYVTDVAGGVASHYCYDPKTFGGLVFPTRRRVVQRTPAGPRLSGPTEVFLDYTSVLVASADDALGLAANGPPVLQNASA